MFWSICVPFFYYRFYYNPNITEDAEYRKRVIEQKRLIGIFNAMGDAYPIEIVEGDYVPEQFFAMSRGYEKCPEGGERCFRCYEMRLRETALQAKKAEADYFTTTLTISPLKNAAKINEIGQQLSEELEVPFLPSDFKKKTAIRDRWNYRKNTICTDRITVAAFFLK